ncbi:hypothetical protein CEXT_604311 [Caerostris extrusa]|uniref:Uncharacterized protein n=1 Tax=Caerostris extrusa TaxID=172846 RepID=A0AAV4TAI4_CAEEX|nr:hypothetical protein CEXT_604311 [Caerostris extrusa]
MPSNQGFESDKNSTFSVEYLLVKSKTRFRVTLWRQIGVSYRPGKRNAVSQDHMNHFLQHPTSADARLKRLSDKRQNRRPSIKCLEGISHLCLSLAELRDTFGADYVVELFILFTSSLTTTLI